MSSFPGDTHDDVGNGKGPVSGSTIVEKEQSFQEIRPLIERLLIPPRRLSTGDIATEADQPVLRPRFLSKVGIEEEPDIFTVTRYEETSPPGGTSQNRPKQPPIFEIGPVDEESLASRTESISSTSSTSFLPNAFLNHVDTLALFKPSTRHRPASNPIAFKIRSRSAMLSKHRDTFLRIKFRRSLAPEVPNEIFLVLLQFLTFKDYKALRLTSHRWESSLPQPRLPASYYFPSVLLPQIYHQLTPIDFDTIRHSCKSWFLASLDKGLLKAMSLQSGCYTSVLADLKLRETQLQARRASISKGQIWSEHYAREIEDCRHPEVDNFVSEEWVMSKRLATETMLSAHWRGFLSKHASSASSKRHGPLSLNVSLDFRSFLKSSRRASETYPQPTVKTFTASGCGKYVLVIQGRVVYIYDLLKRVPGLTPLTCIVCPQNVLAVSMDTSFKRYAVAILLEGRLGMCCTLTSGFREATDPLASMGASIDLRISTGFDHPTTTDTRLEGGFVRSTPSMRRAGVKSNTTDNEIYISRRSDTHGSGSSPLPALNINRSQLDSKSRLSEGTSTEIGEERVEQAGFTVETGPRTLYSNLCSSDNLPFSVSICPQKQCVAFGSHYGVELHWVDALTGNDLNKWFPLSAHSECIYFMPPRNGDDSTKKLRIISSAAGPYGVRYGYDATSHRTSTPCQQSWHNNLGGNRRQSMTRLFFGNLPFRIAANYPMVSISQHGPPVSESELSPLGVLRTFDCDYYHALPLSDGAHLIFVDPESGYLCLGTEAPLGSQTKLLRKVICLPLDLDTRMPGPQFSPYTPHGTRMLSRPALKAFATGRDLTMGVRIVAAYSDGGIVLYSIPADVFERVKTGGDDFNRWIGQFEVVGKRDLSMNQFMQPSVAAADAIANSWTSVVHEPDADGPVSDSHYIAVLLHGAEIAHVNGDIARELVVNTDLGELKIWVFTQSGMMNMYKLGEADNNGAQTWIVGQDGNIRNVKQVGRDVERNTTSESPKGKEKEIQNQHIRFQGLDGAMDPGPAGFDLESPDAEKTLGIEGCYNLTMSIGCVIIACCSTLSQPMSLA